MSRNLIELTVDGNPVTLDVEGDCAIVDLSEDMENIAATVAWYGNVLAAVRAESQERDDNYRRWRATYAENRLAKEPKMAEWKVKAAMESDPGFMRHRQGLREIRRIVSRLESAVRSLEVKADMLRSLGAMSRAELSATGMATKKTA